MSESDRPDQRQARIDAIIAARDTFSSLPARRREALDARIESASSRAQQQAEYRRR
jgi:hypothetical protein